LVRDTSRRISKHVNETRDITSSYFPSTNILYFMRNFKHWSCPTFKSRKKK